MKIFNWMHHMLHPRIKYSQVSQKKGIFGGNANEKQEVIFEGVMEKEALLFHDVLNSILTIGTLGDQDSFFFQSYSTQEDELLQEEEESAEVKAKGGGKEVAPAAVVCKTSPLSESFKFKLPVEAERIIGMSVQDIEEHEKIQELPLLKDNKEKREQGRTTLADLFAADDHAENADKGTDARFKQHACASEKKKNKKEEKWTSATTISTTKKNRKLQKVITKVLKKKIHPEMTAVPKAAGLQTKEGSI